MTKEIPATYTSEVPALYPSPEKEARMFIRKADWSRIKRTLENIRPEGKFMRTAYSLCSGIFITAGFSIYSVYKIPEKSPWLVPTYTITTIAAFTLATILFFVDRHVTKSSIDDIKLILKDIEEIEDTFKRETGEETEEEGIDSSSSSFSSSSISSSIIKPLVDFSKFKKP